MATQEPTPSPAETPSETYTRLLYQIEEEKHLLNVLKKVQAKIEPLTTQDEAVIALNELLEETDEAARKGHLKETVKADGRSVEELQREIEKERRRIRSLHEYDRSTL